MNANMEKQSNWTYQEFNRDNLKMIRRQLEVLLGAFGEEHGLEINLKNFVFEQHSFRVPMHVKIKGSVTLEEHYNQDMLHVVMKEQGLQFDGMNGEKLVDYMPNRPKYPFIYTKRGNKYKCPLSRAKVIFGLVLPSVLHTGNLFGEKKLKKIAPPKTR